MGEGTGAVGTPAVTPPTPDPTTAGVPDAGAPDSRATAAPEPVPPVAPEPVPPVAPPPVAPRPDAAPASSTALNLLAERPEVIAARAEVRAARGDLEDELVRLEAAARAAVDVKAKVRRNPGRAAGVAAGVGFVALGGPGRVIRGARSAIFGKPDPLPDAMLPEEIEKALKAMGTDGARVRGALERDFAGYLEKTGPKRRDLRSTLIFLLLPTARVLILRFGRQLIEEILSPRAGFAEQLEKVRARRAPGGGKPPTS